MYALPSPAVVEFVRLGGLTCRFPGCDHPAEIADIDHTHPSNVKVLCRRRSYHGDMAGAKKNDPRGPNKAEPQTKAKPAPSAVPGSNKKKK
jgi:hypothetical protein